MMGRLIWRFCRAVTVPITIAVSLLIIGSGLLPAERMILYLTKPNRVDTAELALLDIPTGLSHPITFGADILSFTTTPTPYSVLYISRVSGGHAFYRLDVRTRKSSFMMTDPTQAITPTISPDGTQLIYDNFSTQSLYKTRLSDLQSERIFNYNGVSLAFPDFSPDNESIVLTMPRWDRDGADLVSLNLTTMEQSWLTNTRESETHPRYSPDGTQLVYRVVLGARHALVVQDIASGESETIFVTDNNLWGPDWSSRGDAIVFQITQENNSNLYVLNLDSGNLRQLTESPGWYSNPVWMNEP